MQSAGETRRVFGLILVALLLTLSLAKFIYQDVRRLAYPVNDLTTPWVSAKAWTHGQNPYGDSPELAKIWADTRTTPQNGCTDYVCILSRFPMAYPPSALVLLAPLGTLHWSTAVYTCLAGSTVLFVAMLLLLVQRLQLPWSDPRKLFLVAFALAFAPLHSGIHESNLNTVIVACLCAAVVFMATRPCLSGTALALAICLKPQVAFLFFAYPWLRRKWRTAFTALGVSAAISAVSAIWMSVHHVAWLKGYLGALSAYSSPNSNSSFYAPGPGKFQLLNLQVIAYQLTHVPAISNAVSLALFALLALLAAFLIVSRVSENNEAAGIAIVSVLTLLPVYQRFYAAALLIFVMYWAVEHWPERRAKVALVLMSALLLPLASMTQQGRLAAFVEDHHLDSHLFWNLILMPHVIWIELILLLMLLADLGRTLPPSNFQPRAGALAEHDPDRRPNSLG